MALSAALHRKIVDFLISLPNINESSGRQALIHRAMLDAQLQSQIRFSEPSAHFFELLVPQLIQYGQLEDGRSALESVLEATKNYIGQDRREYCDHLIQELHTVPNGEALPKYLSPLSVQLSLEGDIQDLNETKRQVLINIIAAILEIERSSIRILHVTPASSFHVIMALPAAAALEFVALFKTNSKRLVPLLHQFFVKNINIIEEERGQLLLHSLNTPVSAYIPKCKENFMKIKILFLSANPTDTARLRLDQESRAIDQALRQSEFRDYFDIKQHWAVRVADLQGYFLRHKPDIVHFSGHGSKSNQIILENNDGSSHPVSVRALSLLFSVLKDNLKCVVLNSCYSEQQANAIAEHIDCVIGMSQAIKDSTAISFATAFYQALGYGRDVKTAFDLGCIQIDLESLNEEDRPKLIALETDPSKITFVTEDVTQIDENKQIWSDHYNEKGREKYREWATKHEWDWFLLAHAIQFYVKSIDYNHNNQHPWINLAYTYFVIGEKKIALEYLQKGLELATPGENYPGRHYKQVETAIKTNRSITGTLINPPSIPDWFYREYVLNRRLS